MLCQRTLRNLEGTGKQAGPMRCIEPIVTSVNHIVKSDPGISYRLGTDKTSR
jgi:hypothetical protein